MEKSDIIKKLYNDFYFQDVNKKYRISYIDTEKESFYIISKINAINKYENIDDFFKYCMDEFRKDYLGLEKITSEDSYYIEKVFAHIQYPFFPNLMRLFILSDSISNDYNKIFEISIEDIYNITALIILRQVAYNVYFVSKDFTSNDRYLFFGETTPDIWYSIENLSQLNSNITLETFKKYFNMFSIDINNISSQDNIFKILKNKDKFCVLYLSEYVNQLFYICEEKIINYYKNISNNQLIEYYKRRGTYFEKAVNNMLKELYPDVYSNLRYISNDKKNMEIDNLVLTQKLALNFECKSSIFNVYNNNNDLETLNNLRKSFGRGYFSIQKFHDTVKINDGKLTLKSIKDNKEIVISNKNLISYNVTLNPIEFISTSIHIFDKESREKISIFPITINYVDLYSIILACKDNRNIFEKYSIERFNSINEAKKLKIDFDEIDSFGYILDDNLNNGYSDMKNILFNQDNVEQHIMINNSAYRKEINNYLDNSAIYIFKNNLLDKKVKDVFDKTCKED